MRCAVRARRLGVGMTKRARALVPALCALVLGSCGQPSTVEPPAESPQVVLANDGEVDRLRQQLAAAEARFERCKARRVRNLELLEQVDKARSEARIALAKRRDLVENGFFEIEELRGDRDRQHLIQTMRDADLDGCGAP